METETVGCTRSIAAASASVSKCLAGRRCIVSAQRSQTCVPCLRLRVCLPAPREGCGGELRVRFTSEKRKERGEDAGVQGAQRRQTAQSGWKGQRQQERPRQRLRFSRVGCRLCGDFFYAALEGLDESRPYAVQKGHVAEARGCESGEQKAKALLRKGRHPREALQRGAGGFLFFVKRDSALPFRREGLPLQCGQQVL